MMIKIITSQHLSQSITDKPIYKLYTWLFLCFILSCTPAFYQNNAKPQPGKKFGIFQATRQPSTYDDITRIEKSSEWGTDSTRINEYAAS